MCWCCYTVHLALDSEAGGVRNVFGVDSAVHTIFYNWDDGDGVLSLIYDTPNLDFELQLLRLFYGHQQGPLSMAN